MKLSEETEFEILKLHVRRLVGEDGEDGLISDIRKKLDRLTFAVLVLAILVLASNPALLKLVVPLIK